MIFNLIFIVLIFGNLSKLTANPTTGTDDLFTINVTMHGYDTTKEDEYAYVKYELPDEELTIVGYSPLIRMDSAHHMLTYACDVPGSGKPFWTGGSSCGGGKSTIIHGWGRNAPALSLPKDVGFVVGKNTPYKYIVVNIHYFSILKNDHSGNQLILSRKPPKLHAGVVLSGTNNIYLRPKTHSIRTPFGCRYDGPPISIFAARVHAHQWARVNSLYRVRDDGITQIVKGDPQWPQSFYPLETPIDIKKGDFVMGQCVYDNDEDRVIQVGSTHNDEMCNVYAMYSFEPFDSKGNPVVDPFSMCWDNALGQTINLIPADSEVPPKKPDEMSQMKGQSHQHSEHAMHVQPDDDDEDEIDRSEDETSETFEKSYSRKKGKKPFDLSKILSQLGLPDYEYVDAQNYDDLLPQHLTYGQSQTVKLHRANLSTSELYSNVETWPDVKSLPKTLGQIGGIALTNDNSELVVFHRGGRIWEYKYFTDNYRFRHDTFGPIEDDVIIHIDVRTGKVKSRWGAKMFYMPHGLTIDHEGNYWVTDIGMHQVLMFKPTDLTHPALTVGKLFDFGTGPNHFCRPADVTVMKNGDFFVADGYCNNRIVKFNRKGEYVTEWGSATSADRDKDGFPPANQWNIVHSITLNEKSQLICAADRENNRIQCFNSTTGEFIRQIRVEKNDKIGPIFAITFVPNANATTLFAVTGGAQLATKKVYMINAENGEILNSFESKTKPLTAPHDIAVSANAREVYVAELATSPENALLKFELSSTKEMPKEVFTKKMNFVDKNFRISLIILIAFGIPVLLIILCGCFVRCRNLREINRMNSYVNNGKSSTNGHNSMFGDLFNRRDGFKLLEQHSDDENEILHNGKSNGLNDESEDETFARPATTTMKKHSKINVSS